MSHRYLQDAAQPRDSHTTLDVDPIFNIRQRYGNLLGLVARATRVSRGCPGDVADVSPLFTPSSLRQLTNIVPVFVC